MTTDPVERVARWTPEAERLARILAESNGCDPDKVLKWGPVGPIRVWGRYLGQSQAVIKRLTDQGIPIDKLLAGEMIAVERSYLEEVRDLCAQNIQLEKWEQDLLRDARRKTT